MRYGKFGATMIARYDKISTDSVRLSGWKRLRKDNLLLSCCWPAATVPGELVSRTACFCVLPSFESIISCTIFGGMYKWHQYLGGGRVSQFVIKGREFVWYLYYSDKGWGGQKFRNFSYPYLYMAPLRKGQGRQPRDRRLAASGSFYWRHLLLLGSGMKWMSDIFMLQIFFRGKKIPFG